MSEQGAPPAQQPLLLNVQYTKDLSFEVPGAPSIFTQLRQAPHVAINLDVQVQRLEEGANVFEVGLAIRAEGTMTPPKSAGGTEEKPTTVFIADLVYAGVFTLNNIPENQQEPILLVECPRLLFPFARNILADVTRDGGIPPVMLGPIDFVGLWQQRRTAAIAAASAENAASGAPN
ncbi:protein-export chaperone SecB [Acidocella sp.]|uniref:protein-export chaperone SecB n=1 Tax=Acidocella sp. TaxID=50710 RepID=UPI002625D3D6|nr:protein-export chaperone SecB [Acidocella sp.]